MSWYEIVQGPELRQGDILQEFPIPYIKGLDTWPLPEEAEIEVPFHQSHAVVLSQSCDLQNDKIHDIIICEVLTWEDAREQMVARGQQNVLGTTYRRNLVAGNIPSLSLLHKNEVEVLFPWSIADFHLLSVVPKQFASSVAEQAGPRLRLRPPYREHLAQAFARYFMRVGLPHEAHPFINEGR